MHYASVAESEIPRIQEYAVPQNTKKAIKFGLKIYKGWKRLTEPLPTFEQFQEYDVPENTKKVIKFGLKIYKEWKRLTDRLPTFEQFQDMSLAITDFINLSKLDLQVFILAEVNTAGLIGWSIICFLTKHLQVFAKENIQFVRSHAHKVYINFVLRFSFNFNFKWKWKLWLNA